MLDFKLEPVDALDGKAYEYSGFRFHEVTGYTLWSLAVSAEKMPDASSALQQHIGLSWSDIGHVTDGNEAQCLGLQREQVFLRIATRDTERTSALRQSLIHDMGSAMTITDQSDSWVTLELSGERCLDVLERICPIDLHPQVFVDGAVARTVMEHLGVILIRHDNRFLLLGARSSADSFVHALTVSAKFVL